MTTFIPFTPSNASAPPFSFQPVLDGTTYQGSVTWNYFGQRWYLTISDLTGNIIFTLPIVESPVAVPIETLSWDNGLVTAVLSIPHSEPLGALIDQTISNCVPDDYNQADVEVQIVSPNSFTYPLTSDPGSATQLGGSSHDINIAGGYFQTSTLVFRNNQFEVNP